MPRSRCLFIVSFAASATVAIPLLVFATAATAATAASASPVPVTARAGGSNEFFNGDSCTSSTFCMAVGGFSRNGRTPGLSEMFSHGRWAAEPVPSPAHGVSMFANEVSCASPASCLFVGDHFAGPRGATSNLAEAWNGSSWRIVAGTGPAGAASSALFDVACPTTRFCLAVGLAGPASTSQNAAYTWRNGTTWRQVRVPHPRRARSSELGGLACFNSRNCMAVGDYTSASGRVLPFAARWHDGRWRLLTTPAVRGQRFTTFNGISCPAASKCVAAGNTEDNTRRELFHAFAEVWNGSRWKVSTLRRQPSLFIGVSCPARNRCFASGSTFPAALDFAHPLIETWNGATWRAQRPVRTSAPHAGDVLVHVSCAGRSSCEAVGHRYRPGVSNSDLTLAEAWNGHRWKLQATANP